MKKITQKRTLIFFAIIAIMLMASLTACKKKATCFFCDEVKVGEYHRNLADEKVFICDECYSEIYED